MTEDVRGLVRMLDRPRSRHFYAAGATPPGELVGELGSLYADGGDGREAARLTGDGRLATERYTPTVPRLKPLAVMRWLVAPLAWRGFASRSTRLRAVMSRAWILPRCLWRRTGRVGRGAVTAAGWLDGEPGPRSIGLLSAIHPVTGDQLLTTNRWEAVDLGYVDIEQLGYLDATAPVTGRLGTARPHLPWASRFGQAVRTDRAPVQARPQGVLEVADRVAPPFRVSGWALAADASVAHVDVLVDGRVIGTARLGLERPDAAAQIDHVDAPVCGFDHIVRANDLPAGRARITIAAAATDVCGARFDVGDETEVAIEEPASAGEVVGRGEALREQTRQLCRSIAAPPTTDVNALVVVNDLTLGGAGLWLQELITRLAKRPRTRFTVVAPSDGPLRASLEARGIPVHISGVHSLQGVDEYEGQLAQLATWAAPQAFSVAIVNTLRAFPGVEVAELLGIPSVFAIHESYDLDVWFLIGYPPGTVHPYAKERAREALRRARAVVFEAEATRNVFAHHGDPERFIALPYGIELEEIDRQRKCVDRDGARDRLGLDADAQLVLCLGQVEPRKGQACLMQAFRATADRHPGAVLALVGESSARRLDPFNSALRDHIERAGLAARVKIVPPATPPYDWLAAADVLVSASNVESLPRVILEAMAFEVPVVATRIFGVPEVIDDGRTGWLCEPNDLAALADALDRALAATPEQRSEVAAEAHRVVRANHDAALYADRFAALIEGLATDAGADPRRLLGVGPPVTTGRPDPPPPPARSLRTG